MANKLSVAFIGTGIMGAPIAGHILDAGYPVTVNNRTKSKAAALIERGAAWADTPADAVANADVVFTMVGYPSEVEELYLAGDGLLACTKPGAVLIDLTTSSPELARDIAEAAQVSGRMAFDCPVTGGESGAIAGTLTAIVGATENDIASVRDILSTFAATICCFDGAGKGQAAKLANQVSLGACMVGMADAMAFAELSGLDLEKTRQMILGGTGKAGDKAAKPADRRKLHQREQREHPGQQDDCRRACKIGDPVVALGDHALFAGPLAAQKANVDRKDKEYQREHHERPAHGCYSP